MTIGKVHICLSVKGKGNIDLYSATSHILQLQRHCTSHTEMVYGLGRIPNPRSRTLAWRQRQPYVYP